ncbi:two-component system C4-dicarboxylate transport sensor histidine kinase DctB [Rubricella aquisinus]|uniref:C4-dicarboxylate transport sensor protein DctB n=1 Tax=Rubricella aquisinus TaxID=2028108 RepID=A0A840X5Z9_9RHOB|nr:ATP-binding protein [Rubricella aquisinus]MBB5516137.1 two-component system C4-dicarboxylate transport sensor histidine kinase DctB [Rubricella aquisinus]
MARGGITSYLPKGLGGIVAASLALAIVLSVIVHPRVERMVITQSGARAEATLRLAFEGLQGALRQYAPLPALVAERPLLTQVLKDPDNDGLLPFVNEQLRQTALRLDASDVYLMDMTGLTIAASNYRTDRPFIGQRFDYRPYFTQARDGGLGRFAALGTTSGERGYFFASPVLDNTRIIGVLAIKISLERFEEAWRGGTDTIIVSDLYDIVFMSNRVDWHFRALSPLTSDSMAEIEATRQYPLDRITPLAREVAPFSDDFQLVTLGDAGEHIASSTRLFDAGWTVTVLTPTGPARTQALAIVAIMVLVILFLGTIGAIYQQRRARLRERFEAQRATQELLEARVAERTVDLNIANRQLQQEVEDRTAAETRLRKTQAELVQAGKLAALGQMSAALSHEFNQPLAAVKSYAENAATFLDRGRAADARENISRISMMADRMASISKHLRNFARRPQEKIGPIPLLPVVQDAIDLMRPRLATARAVLDYAAPRDDIWVMGGRVRLQQVIVNLLTNALDAMETSDAPRIELSVVTTAPGWQVQVRDFGTGVTEDTLAQVFDPFFTTKSPGKGLGLGLSISYNIIKDFGGSLSAHNHAEQGAVFVIDLMAASPHQKEEVAAE